MEDAKTPSEFFGSVTTVDEAQSLKAIRLEGGLTVHNLDITPGLKEEALKKGFPLFPAAAVPLTDDADPSVPDILLSDPFIPGEPTKAEREETQVAGILGPVIRGFRKAQAGADEIARQRRGPGAKPQSLVGDLEKPLIETVEGAAPQQFLDLTGAPPLPATAININLSLILNSIRTSRTRLTRTSAIN